MITREQITGAIKVLNAGEVMGRKEALRKMLEAEHAKKAVDAVMSDLESYPDWGKRLDLDNPPEPDSVGKLKKVKSA